MKIDLLSIDQTQFMLNPHIINGESVYLIQPQHIGTKWNQNNKYLRSVITDYEGNVISMGFPKFTNFGENPEHFPTPTSLKNCVCVEKLDGSLLILSKWKGQYIIRTRGTVDASKMENAHELEIFKKNILSKLENNKTDWNISILFEWCSPTNRIVVRVDEPIFKLIGMVNHSDGSLWEQHELDYSASLYEFLRPQVYSFDSISDMVNLVEKWEGKEGVVLYSDNGQKLHKIKSDWYLIRHRLKEEFNNLEKVVDFFIQENCPTFSEFNEKVSLVTDWETVNEIQGDISNICDAWKNVKEIIKHMKLFVEPLKSLTRKEAALKIINSYGNTNRSSFCFSLLDGKELDKDQLKKLLWQSLKK
jgi:hypothetical protein